MLFKIPFLAALAALTSAIPTAEPAGSAEAGLSLLGKRQSTSRSGLIGFYADPDFGRFDFYIAQLQQDRVWCQQFEPTLRAPYSFRSYVLNAVAFVGYTTTDCSGRTAVVLSVSLDLFDCFCRVLDVLHEC